MVRILRKATAASRNRRDGWPNLDPIVGASGDLNPRSTFEFEQT